MMSTSLTAPNIAKYSRSFSELVCHERPPTNSLAGAGDAGRADTCVGAPAGVERPDDGAVSAGRVTLVVRAYRKKRLPILSRTVLHAS